MPFALTADRERELNDILTRYPTKMAACIPLLHLCQDQEGYVSEEIILFVSHRLDLSPAPRRAQGSVRQIQTWWRPGFSWLKSV